MSEPPSPFDCPAAFLSSIQFHQRIPSCPRTGLAVTYSVVGDPNGPPFLFCLPAGNSRLIPLSWHPLAKEFGLRIISVDRPGGGGTGAVKLKERFKTSGLMMESVLEREGVVPGTCGLISASNGTYYAFHLLLHHTHLFSPTNPRLYLISPWFPPSFTSSFHPLLLVPTFLIRNPFYARSAVALGTFSQPAFIYSTQALDEINPGRIPRRKSKDEEERKGMIVWDCFPAEFFSLRWDSMLAEDFFRGTAEEYLVCLSREITSGEDWYAQITADILKQLEEKHALLSVEIWWGENDALVGKGARAQMDALLSSHPAQIKLTRHSLPNRGHEDIWDHQEGVLHMFQNIVRDKKEDDANWREWYGTRPEVVKERRSTQKKSSP